MHKSKGTNNCIKNTQTCVKKIHSLCIKNTHPTFVTHLYINSYPFLPRIVTESRPSKCPWRGYLGLSSYGVRGLPAPYNPRRFIGLRIVSLAGERERHIHHRARVSRGCAEHPPQGVVGDSVPPPGGLGARPPLTRRIQPRFRASFRGMGVVAGCAAGPFQGTSARRARRYRRPL